MEYPNNYEIPAFPAGKRIAVSRVMTIGIMAIFLVVIFLCSLILWGARSQYTEPYVITIDKNTQEWSVLQAPNGVRGGVVEYSYNQMLQEYVVGSFASIWFTISENAEGNSAMWQTCDRATECGIDGDYTTSGKACTLYCIAGDGVFVDKFLATVVPDYLVRIESGERLALDRASMKITPVGTPGPNGGLWRVFATVHSNISGPMEITAFAKVVRDTRRYPRTMGFYVSDFNAYRID